MSAVVEPQVLRSGRAISTRRNANVPPAGEKPGLDIRSLNLNYELMLRLEDEAVAVEARGIFERLLKHSRRIQPRQWRKSQTFWQRWENHWAHFLLTRIDPLVALRQFRTMKG
jgi:hypothetical protein